MVGSYHPSGPSEASYCDPRISTASGSLSVGDSVPSVAACLVKVMDARARGGMRSGGLVCASACEGEEELIDCLVRVLYLD